MTQKEVNKLKRFLLANKETVNGNKALFETVNEIRAHYPNNWSIFNFGNLTFSISGNLDFRPDIGYIKSNTLTTLNWIQLFWDGDADWENGTIESSFRMPRYERARTCDVVQAAFFVAYESKLLANEYIRSGGKLHLKFDISEGLIEEIDKGLVEYVNVDDKRIELGDEITIVDGKWRFRFDLHQLNKKSTTK
jgi:hypothetical protein